MHPTGLVLSGLQYKYDEVGNMFERTRLTDNRFEAFDYDGLNRIGEWLTYDFNGGALQRSVAWSWDNADNLDLYSDSFAGSTLDSSANSLNQQTSLIPTLASLDWTARGEESGRTGPAGTQSFLWDALGRPMTSQFIASGVPVTVDWSFDGFGRLLERSDTSRGTVQYTWLGSMLVQTDSSSGGLVEVIPGAESAPLARIWNGQSPSYFHVEATGNVQGIFNSTALLEGYEYEPFGVVRNAVSGQHLAASAVSNELFFGAAPHDLEQKWSHFGARMYDAGMGRFASRDPMGEEVGQNLYSYAFANPLRYSDRTGLAPSENQLPVEAGSSGSMYNGDRFELGDYGAYASGVDVVNEMLLDKGSAVGEYLSGHTLARLFDLDGYLSSDGYVNHDISMMSSADLLATVSAMLALGDWSADGLTSEQATALAETRAWLKQGREALGASMALNGIAMLMDIPEFATSELLQSAGMSESAADRTAMVALFAFGGVKNGIAFGLRQAAGETLEAGAKNAVKRTSRAARREAMREAGIPTSRPALFQSGPSGRRQLGFEGGDGSLHVVSQHPADAVHPNPHWHAAAPKVDASTGQPIQNNHGQLKFLSGGPAAEYLGGGK